MKKIIITLLCSLCCMGLMAAQIVFVEDGGTKITGDLCYLKLSNYKSIYAQDKSKYSATIQVNGGAIIERSEAYNATTEQIVIQLNGAPGVNDEVIVTLIYENGDCGIATFTGEALSSQEACDGEIPDPNDPVEPSSIEFNSVDISAASAHIYSNIFNGASVEDFSVKAYHNESPLNVTINEITAQNGGKMLVVNTVSEYQFPVTFVITKKDDSSCGILTATSANQFTQSACPTATSVSITEVTPGVDYIDLEWEIMGYDPTHAYILYKKDTDANFTRMEVSPIKRTARITGLAANTDYVVKVRLEQQDGEGAVIDDLESEEANTKTASASMSLKQVGAYTNYLTIGWDVNFTAELYTVMYRKNGSKEEFLRYELSGAASSATITGLNEHTAYEVQVVAQLSAAQGGSRTATGVFTTLHRTSCNTVSYETETEDNSFTGDNVCAFNEPYEVEAYTTYDANQTPTIRIRYHYTQGVNEGAHQVWFFKREPGDATILNQIGQMTKEGETNWYYQDITNVTDGDYFYFAVKAVTNEACTSRNTGNTINQGGMYVTRKLNYKVGVGCNDATELEFTKGEGDKVFYLQSNATIARVEVYNPSDQLVDTPEITKPGPNYVLNIADNTAFPTGTYTFKLYDINGRLSDVDLVYTIY